MCMVLEGGGECPVLPQLRDLKITSVALRVSVKSVMTPPKGIFQRLSFYSSLLDGVWFLKYWSFPRCLPLPVNGKSNFDIPNYGCQHWCEWSESFSSHWKSPTYFAQFICVQLFLPLGLHRCIFHFWNFFSCHWISSSILSFSSTQPFIKPPTQKNCDAILISVLRS